MQNNSFPQKYTTFLWVPVVIGLVGIALNYATDSGLSPVLSKPMLILGLFSLALTLATYVAEIRFTRRNFPTKKFKFHVLILVAAVIAPAIAAFAGDTAGSANFGDEPFGGSVFGTGIAIGLSIAVLFLYALTIDTLIFIRSKGLNSGYNIFSKVVYIIGWLIIAGASYFIYSVIYSLHDPSTE